MKTQHRSNYVLMTGVITTILIVLGMSSCNTPADGAKAASKAEAPEVDIHTAVLTGNKEALKQHIAAGTDINEKDPFGGSSPLISASLFGKTDEAKILIDAGADINFQNNDGSTALHTASFFCRPEIVRLLLDKGADKTITNKFGATAYQSISGPFADSKNVYDVLGKALAPLGLKLDYAYLEKTRPEIAELLK
jgi:ankyrin repeat protein